VEFILRYTCGNTSDLPYVHVHMQSVRKNLPFTHGSGDVCIRIILSSLVGNGNGTDRANT
jgi:hypothetical protein